MLSGLREALEPLEEALLAHHAADAPHRRHEPPDVLRLHFDDGAREEVPVRWFFRPAEELDAIDRAALDRARGRVLDVGAGAGVHALPLQARGHGVTALEILPAAVRILGERGVREACLESVWDHRPGRPYDTVLMLMNGTGLAGTLPRLTPLLERVRTLLAPDGRALIDSTDPGDEDFGDGRHPGERQIQLEYRGRRGPPFPHLYVDADTLAEHAAAAGLTAEILVEEPDGRFLAELRRSSARGTQPG